MNEIKTTGAQHFLCVRKVFCFVFIDDLFLFVLEHLIRFESSSRSKWFSFHSLIYGETVEWFSAIRNISELSLRWPLQRVRRAIQENSEWFELAARGNHVDLRRWKRRSKSDQIQSNLSPEIENTVSDITQFEDIWKWNIVFPVCPINAASRRWIWWTEERWGRRSKFLILCRRRAFRLLKSYSQSVVEIGPIKYCVS